MKVSVIIPVRNRERYIGPCLESLLDQDIGKDSYEIIVVDNGSIDRTAQIIRSYPVKYLYLENPSISGARNLGIRNSSAEYVAFIDSDAVADKDWLKELLKGFDHPRQAGCGGKILVMTKGEKTSVLWTRHEDYIEGSEMNLPVIFAGNAIFKKSIVLEVGLFDDASLPVLECEDIDLSWRIHLYGYKFKYIERAVVYHSCYRIRDLLKRGYRQGRANTVLEQKYYFIDNLYEKEIKVSSITRFFLCRIHNDALYLDDSFILRIIKATLYTLAYLLGWIFVTKKKKSFLCCTGFKDPIIGLTEKRVFGIVETKKGKLRVSKGVIWIGPKDEIRISNLISGNRLLVNETGSFIWNQILDSKTINEIVSGLDEIYNTGRLRIEEGLNEFISGLVENGFLRSITILRILQLERCNARHNHRHLQC